jgi:inhibitor of KinA
MNFQIRPLGDQALVIETAEVADVTSARRTHAISRWLEDARLPGVSEIVPSAATVTLFYSAVEAMAAGAPHPDVVTWLAERVRQRLATLPTSREDSTARLIEIPVCYGGEFGPDLEAIAERVKLSAAEVIARHSAVEHVVLQLGFAPGFPYLDGLPEELAVPRRDTPRVAVPAGSVAIANRQTGIYPVVVPGGWNLIGRTPVKLFRPDQKPPVLLQPGDRVKFIRISPNEFAQLDKQ